MVLALLTKDINAAKAVLDSGELVAIPTETVYGLAAKGDDPQALKAIFNAKGRPINNPLILHFGNWNSILPFVEIPGTDAQLLAEHFWPGPLTLLLPKSDKVPEIVTAGSDRVAVRIPNHTLTLELLNQLDYPLAAPSANPSGYISPTQPMHVQKQLGNTIPMILDGGACESGIESTILGWNTDGQPVIYRQGVITAEAISEVLQRTPQINQKTKLLLAPGMMDAHYAPATMTIATSAVPEMLRAHSGKKIGVIAYEKSHSDTGKIENEIVLAPEGALEEMAQNLYAAMYTLDTMDLDIIIIEFAPEEGVGKAINDRIRRSAAR